KRAFKPKRAPRRRNWRPSKRSAANSCKRFRKTCWTITRGSPRSTTASRWRKCRKKSARRAGCASGRTCSRRCAGPEAPRYFIARRARGFCTTRNGKNRPPLRRAPALPLDESSFPGGFGPPQRLAARPMSPPPKFPAPRSARLVGEPEGKTVFEMGKKFGRDTNNVAEYYGLLAALDYATSHGIRSLRIQSD